LLTRIREDLMRARVIKRYDEAFRKEAVALLKPTNRTLGAVADDLVVPCGPLRHWYNVDIGKKRGLCAARSR
jgi:hypothetical protein